MEDVLMQDLNIKDYSNNLRLRYSVDNFPYQGIWVFSGAQGFGKTLLMIQVLREIVKKYPDCIVCSNISLYGIPCVPYTGIEDFEKYNNGQKGIIYVLDEIQTFFSSLESKNMPLSTLTVFSQNRKNRRVILGTSQRFTRISKAIREQCKYHIECKKPIFNFYRYRVLDATLYDDNGNYIGKKTRFSLYVPNHSSFLSYSTEEVVVNNGRV